MKKHYLSRKQKPVRPVRVGMLYAARISFALWEREQGCSYCGSTGKRVYFAYGRLQHVYCNKDCMISHQLEGLMEPIERNPK